jgi:hypothetical protein
VGSVISAARRLDGEIGVAEMTRDGCSDQACLSQCSQRGTTGVDVPSNRCYVQLGQQHAQVPTR